MILRLGNIIFWAVIVSVFFGSSIGFRTGSILWFPLRILTILYVPFLLSLHPKMQPPIVRFAARFFLLLALYGILSLAWSPDKSLGFSRAAIQITGILLFLIGCQRMARPGKVAAAVGTVWSLAVIVTSLLGLYEIYTGSYLIAEPENMETSERLIASQRNLASFGWLCPMVTSANWNNFAFTNALSFLLLLGYACEASGLRRFLATGASLLASILVVFSTSRAAILGVLVGLCVFGLGVVVAPASSRRARIIVMATIVMVVAIGLGTQTTSESPVWHAISSRLENSSDSDGVRLYYIKQGVGAAIDSLGFGRGVGCSTVVIEGGSYHNYAIELLAEFGVVAFVGFLGLLLYATLLLCNALRRLRDMPYKSAALLGGCVAFPILQVGPSSIIGEGVYWLWLAVLITHVGSLRQDPDLKKIAR